MLTARGHRAKDKAENARVSVILSLPVGRQAKRRISLALPVRPGRIL